MRAKSKISGKPTKRFTKKISSDSSSLSFLGTLRFSYHSKIKKNCIIILYHHIFNYHTSVTLFFTPWGLQKAMCLWVLDPVDREAVLVNQALNKRIPDYNVVIEITCTKTPEEVLTVKRAYQLRFKRALEEDVASYTTAGKIGKVGITKPSK